MFELFVETKQHDIFVLFCGWMGFFVVGLAGAVTRGPASLSYT